MCGLFGTIAEETASGTIFNTLFFHVFLRPPSSSVEGETLFVQRRVLRANVHVFGDNCLLRVEFLFQSTTCFTGILYNCRN